MELFLRGTTIQLTVKVGQKPSKKEMKRIRAEMKEAEKYPINLADCPELPPEALKEFATQRAGKNRQKKRATVTIRIVPDCLEKYKALGKGYTGIMADVLNYVADNPEFLRQVIQSQERKGQTPAFIQSRLDNQYRY